QCDDTEASIFHAGSLTCAQHEQKQVYGNEREIADSVNPENTPVRSKVLGHFQVGRYEENDVERGDDRKVRNACSNARPEQLALIVRERKLRCMFGFFEVEPWLVFLN